ncbi:MAG: GGDEF domain-containing protein [Burkholderiaceae bacterium]|nr:GGDEF domain-containing protein [Rhodoferax sp.]MCP5284247.1 GGDEF domain-containing protein [Burkholderiaceae bacterium]
MSGRRRQATSQRRFWSALALWLTLALGCVGWAGAQPVSGGALQLRDAVGRIDAWPALRMLPDTAPTATTAEAAWAQIDRFVAPSGAAGTLGLRRDAVWLHLPLQVAPDSEGRWVLDLGYAVLNRVDVWLQVPGRAPQHWVIGNEVPRADRPLDSRTPAVVLDLPAGSSAALLLRVRSAGALILPMALSTPTVFHRQALDEQVLQGLLSGLGLFLVLYSLSQWWSVRDGMFLRYALLTFSSVMFSVAQFGHGAMYLWGDLQWFERHVPGLSALLASTGSCLFVQAVLADDRPRGWISRALQGCAALLVATALAFSVGLIHVHVVSAIIGTLGLAPALLGLPGALRRLRRGDAVGGYFLVAWVGYFFSTWVMVQVIQGRLPATWSTLHAFQFGATLDMLIFLRVISLRLASVHAAAQERDTLRSMAHTDPLTGLPNRRGLPEQIEQRLRDARADRQLALVVLDLDGFKAVNDRHGHAVGDALLIAVAARLQANVREHDLVARMGGDEFLVVADGLRNEEQAQALAEHLLQAFAAPFDAAGHRCQVGLTAGYVLAAAGSGDAQALLRAADGAMFEGKRAGKGRVLRATLATNA